MAQVELKQLLEAGAHFGHQTRRWNPKMQKFLYGARGGVHIFDLTVTAEKLEEAEKFVESVTKSGGQVLFVGTKRQGKVIVRKAAESAGQPFVTERWLGGMLTNFITIRTQINRLKKLEQQLESGEIAKSYIKKEALGLQNEKDRLELIFGGIKDMNGLPAAMFVTDVPREMIAVQEANKLGIPVVAITDSNADPDLVQYVIPANDDAIKTVQFISTRMAEVAAEGAKQHQASSKEDKGEGEK